MRITYTGPHVAVDVPALGLRAQRERPIEVPDEIATQLLNQRCWSAAAKTTGRTDRKEAS